MKTDEFLIYLHNVRKYSDLTVLSYGTDLKQFEDFLFKDDKNLRSGDDDAAITVNAVRSWIMTLSECGVSARSINRKISALKSYCKWVETNDKEFKNPMLKIIPPKISKRKTSFIAEEDMEKLLEKNYDENDFESFRDFIMTELLYATGIRRAELANIKDTDFSFVKNQLKVLGKGNKERIIPLGEQIICDVIKYIDLKKRLNFKEERFLVTKEGIPMKAWQIYSVVRRILKDYNVSKRSPHVFRHTCATHLINEGADIVNVKNLLGHSSLKATEVYTHTTIEQLKKEYQRLFGQNFN